MIADVLASDFVLLGPGNAKVVPQASREGKTDARARVVAPWKRRGLHARLPHGVTADYAIGSTKMSRRIRAPGDAPNQSAVARETAIVFSLSAGCSPLDDEVFPCSSIRVPQNNRTVWLHRRDFGELLIASTRELTPPRLAPAERQFMPSIKVDTALIVAEEGVPSHERKQ